MFNNRRVVMVGMEAVNGFMALADINKLRVKVRPHIGTEKGSYYMMHFNATDKQWEKLMRQMNKYGSTELVDY